MPPLIAPPLSTSVLVQAYPREPAVRVMPLEQRMSIGRLGYGHLTRPGPIQLFDDRVSAGRHALIESTSVGVIVRDMGSTHTTVNDRQITDHALRVGDEIRCGRSLLRFEHTLAGAAVWPFEAAQLLDAVYEAPADDGPRLVLADWLVERGDPRGELIQTQILRGGAVRAGELLDEHELAWLAPMPVPVESWTFERGFVASLRVREMTRAVALRAYHPLARIEPIAWTAIDPAE